MLTVWLLWHTSYLLSRRINSPSWWYSSYVGNDNNLLTLYVILVTLSRKTLICSWIWWFKSVGRCHIDIYMHSDFDIIPTYALKYMICGKGCHNSLSLLVCDKSEYAYSISSGDKGKFCFYKMYYDLTQSIDNRRIIHLNSNCNIYYLLLLWYSYVISFFKESD